MNLIASAVVTVECPRAKAFDFAADLENFGAWFPAVINIVADDELPFATVGKRYLETVAVPVQGKRVVSIRVVDVSPPVRIITEGDLPMLLPRMQIECHELAPNSCEVHWRMHSRSDNVLVRYTILPLARQVMRRRARAGLRTLKRMLEASETASRGSVESTRSRRR